jgi:prepilin-type processing-associated H-X9-DG protein
MVGSIAMKYRFSPNSFAVSTRSPKGDLSLTGFTITEMLLAMTVIFVLVIILIPAVGRVREHGRRVACANNLRQHGVAWNLYLTDHGDKFPKYDWPRYGGVRPTETFGGGSGKYYEGAWFWVGVQFRVLNPYFDIDSDNDKMALEVFHCPDDTKSWNPPVGRSTNFYEHGNSYLMNWAIIQRPFSSITYPHSKVWVERCSDHNNPGHGGKHYDHPETPVMVLFVDGHVAGPFLYDTDFEGDNFPDTDKPILTRPNG